MTRRSSPLTIVASLLFTLPAAAGLLTPGRWEITVRTVSPVAGAPMTHEVCITEEEAERPPAPPKAKKNDDCQSTGALHGNSLKYTTKCSRKKATSSSEFTYSGDRYEGVVVVQIDGQEVRQVHSGRLIGACEKVEE